MFPRFGPKSVYHSIYLSIYPVNNLGFFRDIADEKSFDLDTSNFHDRLEVISGRPVPIFVALT